MLLKDSKLNFLGNMEARDIISGKYDVVVADGFNGNIALKSLEGAGLSIFKMLKDNIKRLREVLCYLSETQKRRVFKYFFYNKTLEKIADEEGVDFTSVRESVNSAIKKLRKFF